MNKWSLQSWTFSVTNKVEKPSLRLLQGLSCRSTSTTTRRSRSRCPTCPSAPPAKTRWRWSSTRRTTLRSRSWRSASTSPPASLTSDRIQWRWEQTQQLLVFVSVLLLRDSQVFHFNSRLKKLSEKINQVGDCFFLPVLTSCCSPAGICSKCLVQSWCHPGHRRRCLHLQGAAVSHTQRKVRHPGSFCLSNGNYESVRVENLFCQYEIILMNAQLWKCIFLNCWVE